MKFVKKKPTAKNHQSQKSNKISTHSLTRSLTQRSGKYQLPINRLILAIHPPMAFSTASTRPLFNLKLSNTHYSPPLHQPKKKKPVILFSNAHFTPPLRSACNDCFGAKFGTFTNPSRPKLRFSVKAQKTDQNPFQILLLSLWVLSNGIDFALFVLVCVGWISK